MRKIVQALGSGEDEAEGTKVLTEQGEQTMINLWARKELADICSWERVKHMARQARRERLDAMNGNVTDAEGLDASDITCSLCMMTNCHGKWLSESGDEICCQCAEQTVGRCRNDSMREECWGNKIEGQRFDGVAVDTRSKPKRLLTLEVKRMADEAK